MIIYTHICKLLRYANVQQWTHLVAEIMIMIEIIEHNNKFYFQFKSLFNFKTSTTKSLISNFIIEL